ncbi:hypothetical protein ASG43_03090 [Aureimonas sp. Leaf454]|nr:hypothetical protein ASG43_03090 [Aureimonas sp. Leaf454]
MEGGGENRYSEPIVRHFGDWELSKIKPGDITAAARKLKPDANAATRNRQVITPTRAIINHAANLGWCPMIRVKHFKVETSRRVSVERSWIDAFVAQADADGLPHLSAIVLMMFQTGTRVSEACRVKPADLDLDKRVIVLNKTKTGTFRPKHITRELADRIGALDLDPEKPVFGYADRFGVRNRMIAVCRRAGIEFVSPHQAGRHSFATNALAMGATLKDAMEAGDWKSSRLFLETYAKSEKAGQITADLFDAQNETSVSPNGHKTDTEGK